MRSRVFLAKITTILVCKNRELVSFSLCAVSCVCAPICVTVLLVCGVEARYFLPSSSKFRSIKHITLIYLARVSMIHRKKAIPYGWPNASHKVPKRNLRISQLCRDVSILYIVYLVVVCCIWPPSGLWETMRPSQMVQNHAHVQLPLCTGIVHGGQEWISLREMIGLHHWDFPNGCVPRQLSRVRNAGSPGLAGVLLSTIMRLPQDKCERINHGIIQREIKRLVIKACPYWVSIDLLNVPFFSYM